MDTEKLTWVCGNVAMLFVFRCLCGGECEGRGGKRLCIESNSERVTRRIRKPGCVSFTRHASCELNLHELLCPYRESGNNNPCPALMG